MLMSLPFPPKDGIGNYVDYLSKNLIRKGHQVTILTRGGYKDEIRKFNGINVIYPKFFPIRPFHVDIHSYFVKKIFKIYNLEGKNDVIHVHTPLPPYIRSSLPVITTVHTTALTESQYCWNEKKNFRSLSEKLFGNSISYRIESKWLKKSAIITTVSNSVAQELKQYKINRDKIRVIGNGVDIRTFSPSKEKNDQEYILYIGRLDPRKGLFDIIECGKYVCMKRPNTSFIIVGKGMLENVLKKKVREAGLQKNFIFLGFVDKKKLIQLYQNATICVIPSHYEGLPTVLLEAMSCGLPVVATAISGSLDVVSSGENGILIPPKSPKEMANAISMLLDNDEIRKKLGKNARKTIEERFTWDIISDKILKCYESLVKV